MHSPSAKLEKDHLKRQICKRFKVSLVYIKNQFFPCGFTFMCWGWLQNRATKHHSIKAILSEKLTFKHEMKSDFVNIV